MQGPEQEPSYPRKNLHDQIEAILRTNVEEGHPQLKPFISSEELHHAAERIAALSHDLVQDAPISSPRGLSLFHDMVEISVEVPDDKGITLFSSQSQSMESRCVSFLGRFPNGKEEETERMVAQSIIGTVLGSIANQLRVTYERIRTGKDIPFDLVLINSLGGKDAIIQVFLVWYAEQMNHVLFESFAQLTMALGKKTERTFSSALVPPEQVIKLSRSLMADVLFGLDVSLVIAKSSPEKTITLDASFEISIPKEYGRSRVESGVELPPNKPLVYSSISPGSDDLSILPENMIYFLRFLLDHLSFRDLWSELE